MTRIILYGQKSIHIDGYKSIISLCDTRILIRCSSNIAEITGEKLFIAAFSGIEMTVSGVITGIKWIDM